MFGVHIDEEGLALRGTFIVNPDGVIKTAEIHDNSIARDVKETLRKLQAAQYVAKPGPGLPAKWQEGAKTLTRRSTSSARSDRSRLQSPPPAARRRGRHFASPWSSPCWTTPSRPSLLPTCSALRTRSRSSLARRA